MGNFAFKEERRSGCLTDARVYDPSDFTCASAPGAVAACLSIHFSKTLRAARSLRYSRPYRSTSFIVRWPVTAMHLTVWGTADTVAGNGEQRGYFKNEHSNGDVDHGTFEAKLTMSGNEATLSGTWRFSGGTGKFAKITVTGCSTANRLRHLTPKRHGVETTISASSEGRDRRATADPFRPKGAARHYRHQPIV